MIDWEDWACQAEEEAARFALADPELESVRKRLDAAINCLGGEDVGRHRIKFIRDRWDFGDVALPAAAWADERITRQRGFDVAGQPAADAVNWELFCTSFVFGYGPVGYGPSRFRKITTLTRRAELSAIVAEARERLAESGPLSAYDYLRGGRRRRVPYWGPAFFTKLLYFADPERRALILDNRMARIVHQLSDMEHLVNKGRASERWTAWRYGVYLAWMRQTAERLQVQPDFLEYALFSTGRRCE